MKLKINKDGGFGQPEIKKDFRKRLTQLRQDALQIPDEQFRSDVVQMIDTEAEYFRETRFKSAIDLIDYVVGATDTVRIAVSRGLYGHHDPRTQKLIDAAEDRAMESAQLNCGR